MTIDATKKPLSMTFDPRTIEHLGIRMYSTLPPVIAELVSNAYDAEANNVIIKLYESNASDNSTGNKKIEILDDGHGMTYDEVNDHFLVIGRNRREGTGDSSIQRSKNGKRLVIGKKGIGKLSFFGISDKIKIATTSEKIKTSFTLDWKDIKEQGKTNTLYRPLLDESESGQTEEKNGTKIILEKIKRESAFSPENLAKNLAKSFQIFDESDFSVIIEHYTDKFKSTVKVENRLRYESLNILCKIKLPDELNKLDSSPSYSFASLIKGELIAAQTTVSSDIRGIALFSRNKLVNEYSFLDLKASSHGYSYITGWLDVDFIEDFENDVISTDRQSLIWDDLQAASLKSYLEQLYRKFYDFQRKYRKDDKLNKVEKNLDSPVESWIISLPKVEQKLARKIVTNILEAEQIDIDKAVEFIKYTKDAFQFEAFKEYAAELDSKENIESELFVELLKDWEHIEAREMHKLSIGRVKTIQTFRELISTDAPEVKVIQPFFEKFSWILDPRINQFEREKTFSSILKEKFPDEELNESNRRLDFLCTSVSEHLFIIELKRPSKKLTKKEIDQAKHYRSFVEQRASGNSAGSIKNVVAYVIGGSISDDYETKDEIESMQRAGKIYLKTYNDLLSCAEKYHKEFISKHVELNKFKN